MAEFNATPDFSGAFANAGALPSNVPCRLIETSREQWLRVAEALRAAEGMLLALWGHDERDGGQGFLVYASYLTAQGLLVARLCLRNGDERFPSLARLFPCAVRMERALHDLLGVASDQDDERGWLRHFGWPREFFPLRGENRLQTSFPPTPEPYPFVSVEGEGVHEIAVGPIHAGIIEPGHFRFSVVGEKVLRLEERLGYTHKGAAKRFQTLSLAAGHRLAARLCGDSSVAYAWAYCAALEALSATVVPPRALWLRALALEHERLANHLGDLGALGNDAGFAVGLTQFSRLKEDLLRLNQAALGARYLFNFVQPGGVECDLDPKWATDLPRFYSHLDTELEQMRSIYDEHAGLQDRFRGAGVLSTATARRLGALGLAARASAIPLDLRVDYAIAPYDRMRTKIVTQDAGDVAARVVVRFQECLEAMRLCQRLLEQLPSGDIHSAPRVAPSGALATGIIEGWRGPVMVALQAGPSQSIRHCHVHDPSWQNWPLLEYAILGNIVPDFPLINKSFNLAYSGQDG